MGESELSDRVIVVTGGRSGIGRAVVERLVRSGATVASLDIAPIGEGDEATDRVELVCDVASPEAVQAAIEEVCARCGGIDGLVQCAGITDDAVLWKMSDTAWSEVLDVNLKGAFNVLRAATPALRSSDNGAVVNVTSINGLRGKFGQSNYAASKAGLIGLTKTAARELGAFGIRVNAVAPGMVRTAMTASLPERFVKQAVAESALGAIAEADDIAEAVLFLLSDRARRITGTTLQVDAGQYI